MGAHGEMREPAADTVVCKHVCVCVCARAVRVDVLWISFYR